MYSISYQIHVVRLRPKGAVERGHTCPQAEVVARVLGGYAEGEFPREHKASIITFRSLYHPDFTMRDGMFDPYAYDCVVFSHMRMLTALGSPILPYKMWGIHDEQKLQEWLTTYLYAQARFSAKRANGLAKPSNGVASRYAGLGLGATPKSKPKPEKAQAVRPRPASKRHSIHESAAGKIYLRYLPGDSRSSVLDILMESF
ncbi:hypothetical protein B0H13DRAFT_678175 [Mycena leptocephala]|nr:hypothetical protein B0H13DRAFT_678175 [Mycena leptocephala]